MTTHVPQFTFKVLLIGDGGVGKTTFCERHFNGKFTKEYNPTIEFDVYILSFNTNYGVIKFYVWDTAGQEKFGKLNATYLNGAKAIIGMCDLTSKLSFKSLEHWYNKYVLSEDLLKVSCGSKYDTINHKINNDDKIKLKDKWSQYYDISAKSNYNYEKPFMYLSQKLTGFNDLMFI